MSTDKNETVLYMQEKLLELVELQSEYIKFLDNEYRPFVQIGIIHGMSFSDECVQKGKDLRDKMQLAQTWVKMLKNKPTKE